MARRSTTGRDGAADFEISSVTPVRVEEPGRAVADGETGPRVRSPIAASAEASRLSPSASTSGRSRENASLPAH